MPERKWPFLPISTSNQNFNPRNTQCMPVVKILIFPDIAGQTHLKKLASVAGFRRKTDDFQPVATQKTSL